jgi:chromatin segregation and condensation protein Rec8/ScpA/Scc1 (kleisin family)
LTPEQEIAQAESQLFEEKRFFRDVYDRLDKHSSKFDRITRFRKRLEKDVEYFVRDLQKSARGGPSGSFTTMTNTQKQLKVIQKKLDNYQRLNQRIREEQEEGGGAAGSENDEVVKHQMQ